MSPCLRGVRLMGVSVNRELTVFEYLGRVFDPNIK